MRVLMVKHEGSHCKTCGYEDVHGEHEENSCFLFSRMDVKWMLNAILLMVTLAECSLLVG